MIKYSISKPVTISMVVLFFIFVGLFSFSNLLVDLFPNISKPLITIETEYKGASAKEIEVDVTKKIEDALSSLSSIKQIHSISQDEVSKVMLEFKWGIELDSKLLDIRQKLDDIKSDLPNDCDNPIIKKYNPTSTPIFSFAIQADFNDIEVLNIIDKKIIQKIERINGVSKVDIAGLPKKIIKIIVDKDKINSHNIDVDIIKNKLENNNLSKMVGLIYENGLEYSVVVKGKFNSLEGIKNLPIKNNLNNNLLLKDIAQISISTESKKVVAKLNNQPSINLYIYKNSDGNSIEIIKKVKQYLELDNKNIEIFTLYDQSLFIQDSIDMVISNGYMGIFFTVIILLLFLRSITSTIIVGITIPISIINTMFFFYIFDISINIFSLIGLTLAIGMIVDSSIVILENSYRLIQMGNTPKKAVLIAITEIKGSIIASNLTTFAVFIPIIFLPEAVGDIFSNLSYAIIFALMSSMLISFTLMPMLISQLVKKSDRRKNFYDIFYEKIGQVVSDFYIAVISKVIHLSIRKKLLSMILLFISFGISIYYMPNSSIFPTLKQNVISFNGSFSGNYAKKQIQNQIDKITIDLSKEIFIKKISYTIKGKEIHYLVELTTLNNNINNVDKIKQILYKYPDFKYKFNDISPMSLLSIGQGEPLNIVILSNDLKLREKAYRLIKQEIFNDINKISNLNIDYTENIFLTIETNELAKKNITAKEFIDICKIKLQGKKVKTATIELKQFDLVLSSNDFISLNEFLDMPIIFNTKKYYISQFVNIEQSNQLMRIYKNEKIVSNSFTISNSENYEEIISKINKMKDILKKDGIELIITGSYIDKKDLINHLAIAFIIAIILVYMVLASQFELLLQPIVILFSIPLSIIGAIVGLLLSGNDLSVPAFIGIVMLIGIVVNNAIVLIEYINVLRFRGVYRDEAILQATKVRLRPIIMTTFTTLLGMFPTALGLGSGAELYQSLAIVVIAGLFISTILTLIIIPLFYILFEEIIEKMKIFRYSIRR